MTTEQITLFNDEVSIEESRKQRRRERERKRYREKLSKNPVVIEKSRRRASEYYEKNKESCKKKNKEWAAAHPDIIRQHKNKYADNNKEKIKNKHKEYYLNNTEIIKIRQKKYKDNNPEKNALKERRRRARKKGAGGSHTIDDINRLKVAQNEKCAVCKSKLGKGYHVDHIMPLALGGSNDASNLQLLCQSCNSSKHAKHPVDFMQERGFLL